MSATGKLLAMSGILLLLLMATSGCSKKSVQGSAGVGAGDRSGMELQADAGSGPTDGQTASGDSDFGEEDLEGGERSPSGAAGLSRSSSESSDKTDGDTTGSGQVTARPGGQFDSTAGSESKGMEPSQHVGDEGSPSQEPGSLETGSGGAGDEGGRLAQKRDGSSARARTLGPAGELPRDRMAVPAVPMDPSDRDEADRGGPEGSLAAGRTGGDDEESMRDGGDELGDTARSDPSSGERGGAGARTETHGSADEVPGAAGKGAAAMADNGGTGDASSNGGDGGGSDDMTTASRGPGGAGPSSEDPGSGEKMPPSAASSGEEDVSESMIVAKVPPPDDAARQRLEDMKRERMESGMRGVQDVFFDFDSWRIRKEDQKVLESNAQWLKTHPQVSLTIEGHTDPRGTQAYNLTLGEKRAQTIRSYLEELGVDPERMRIVSYGKERLFCHEQNERCYQMNRRGHLVVETP